MNKQNVLNVTKITKETDFLIPKQSANVLFKFMSKLDYLKEILINKAIYPRYYEETIDYLEIKDLKKIAFPMSCFCDIHLNRLIYHMDNYGYYGVGIEKQWGIEQGIQPIHYINKNSELKNEYSKVMNGIFDISKEERSQHKVYHDYLLHKLLFMKPIQGSMKTNEDYKERNFHDEKEWRFIPSFKNVETELPLIIDQTQMNAKSYNIYSKGIKQNIELSIKLDLKYIKHIIVNTQDDRKELIKFILDNNIGKDEKDEETYILISKIMVFNELREDW